jgi:hypothetical protein
MGADVEVILPAPSNVKTPEKANWFPAEMPPSNCPILVLLKVLAVMEPELPVVPVAPVVVPVVTVPASLATYP